MIEQLEEQLDSFDSGKREDALAQLLEKVKTGNLTLPEPGKYVNLHCHTFYSYNCYGYSPSKLAWLARKKGLGMIAGIDFDVLDALDEFTSACYKLGMKGFAGLETRVFVPEFADYEINSPGEPGIAYHMGVGFAESQFEGQTRKFLDGLKEMSQNRNKKLTERVNNYLDAVRLNYQDDVIPLTPSGNATERHITLAYARKAAQVFEKESELMKFWSDKLGADVNSLELPEGTDLLNLIRKKTMKKGGAGYVTPDPNAFPRLADVNRFVLEANGIPVVTWLNGLTEGEQKMDELLDVECSSGAAALNIIPDRNFTPGEKDEKLEKLYEVVELAEKRGLPVIAGTEMNSPGQKFVDSFETDELKPLLDVFRRGGDIVYGHYLLQRNCGLGYLSEWADSEFENIKQKNKFYRHIGNSLLPQQQNVLTEFDANATSMQILKAIEKL